MGVHSRTHSAALDDGGRVVAVKAEVSPGLPTLAVRGPSAAKLGPVGARVRCALAYCGHWLDPRSQIVDVGPADASPGIDLAVACAVLIGRKVIPRQSLAGTLLWGELASDGSLRPTPGSSLAADLARSAGFQRLVVSAASAHEIVDTSGLDVLPIAHLANLVAHLRDERLPLEFGVPSLLDLSWTADAPDRPDMADVRGLARARAAVELMIAGRFAAFLVHEFGLAAVLEVCSTTGRHPDAGRLSSAMEKILGAPAVELVVQLATEPETCNGVSRYGARLYACGEDPLAPHAGVVEPNVDFEATYSLGCEQGTSIGSIDDEVRYIQQIEIAEADSYRVSVQYPDGSKLESPPASVVLAKCGYCGEVEEFHARLYGYYFDLEAGRYWLEFRAPANFVGPIELTIQHNNAG